MTRLFEGLAWVGRHGTRWFAASLFVGLALPGLAALARPLLGTCIFAFIALTFLRADLAVIRRIVRRPARLGLACLWLALAPALVIATGLALVGRANLDAGMVLGLAIIAAAPPILSGPAVAAILRIEPSLLLSATVITTLAAPLVSAVLADLVAGAAVPLDRAALALRLAVFIGGAIVVALMARRVLGEERIAARRQSIDGAGVIIYLVFAVAAMDGVTEALLARPVVVASFLGAAFAVSFASLGLTWIGLRPLAPEDRLMFGYASGQRNMGVLIATLGASVPDTTFLFFALAQFPIYLMPQFLKSAAPVLLPGSAGESRPARTANPAAEVPEP